MMLRKTIGALVVGLAVSAASAGAADYVIDKEGQHAFVNFRIGHLGYSWVYGTFRDFDGRFSFDAAQPEASSVQVKIAPPAWTRTRRCGTSTCVTRIS